MSINEPAPIKNISDGLITYDVPLAYSNIEEVSLDEIDELDSDINVGLLSMIAIGLTTFAMYNLTLFM